MVRALFSALFFAKTSFFWVFSILFSLLLVFQALSLGLSDDEAYYWVLAQHPSLAYAFHPPGVAWFIAAAEKIIPNFLQELFPVFVVRAPALLLGFLVFLRSFFWANLPNLAREKYVLIALASFFPFFGLSWMMVPDVLLFLGFILVWAASWELCFSKEDQQVVFKWRTYFELCLGSGFLLLSKYSGVLQIFSACLCFLFFLKGKKKLRPILFLVSSVGFFFIPILIWNQEHKWVSLLYQIRDRHQGAAFSWRRALAFWLSQFVLVGPIWIGLTFSLLKALLTKKIRRESLFVCLWTFPLALIYWIQPFLSEFKIHWAFVSWFPSVLYFSFKLQTTGGWKILRWQVAYGFFLFFLLLSLSQFPIIPLFMRWFYPERAWNPLIDVTNDFYGWSNLKKVFVQKLSPEDLALPRTASRYQTASQVAFALRDSDKTKSQIPVTLVPKTMREKDDWRFGDESGLLGFPAFEDSGIEAWPRLRSAVLFFTDNRYQDGPQFPLADCKVLFSLEQNRGAFLAKKISVWRCAPGN